MTIHLIILFNDTSYVQALCYALWEERSAATDMNQKYPLSSGRFTDYNIKQSLEGLQSPSEQERVRLGCSEEGR